MRSAGGKEIEVKLRVVDPPALRKRLGELGARRQGHVFEVNVLFDTAEQVLFRTGRLLRLRFDGSQAICTFKGRSERSPAASAGRYKVRAEVEWNVKGPAAAIRFLAGLGLRPGFRYDKYRTSYRLPGLPGLSVELDETPIGVFLELEGVPETIDEAARLLGYGTADYITKSYGLLYLEDCRRRGVPPGDMVFTSRKKTQKTSVLR